MTSTHSTAKICDLAIIGAGISGLSAALFAARHGLETILIGQVSEIMFSSGCFDLLGIHPIAEKKQWSAPWDAVAQLRQDIPGHPYAKLTASEIADAFQIVRDFLQQGGYPYCVRPGVNVPVLTAMGTCKLTYAVPHTMNNGIDLQADRRPCLIVGIRGLKGFSAHQVVAAASDQWPGLSAATVTFPNTEHQEEVYAEPMARRMELPETRRRFADAVKPHLKSAQGVGLPPILGVYRTTEVRAHIEQLLGVPVFELPSMPPATPGLRIKEIFFQHLPRDGVQVLAPKRVERASIEPDGRFKLEIGENGAADTSVLATGVILATGRFMGQGLKAERSGIHESLFNLPVFQPAQRQHWHRHTFLDPRGHRINCCGIETDSRFQPLGADGRPVVSNLYACGAILAHSDWMRMKCGSGVAMASAYAAVNAFAKQRRQANV